MARLFLEPTDLLLVIALVLLAVQSGRPCADRLPLLLPLAWLLGGLIGLHLPAELLQAMACTAVVAAAGLLVALGVRLRPRVLLPLVAVLAAAVRPGGGFGTRRPPRCSGGPAGGDRRHRGPDHPAHPGCWLRRIPAGWPSPCGWAAAGSPPHPC